MIDQHAEPPAPAHLGVRAILRRSAGMFGLSTAAALLDGVSAVVASRLLGPESRGVYAIVLTIAGLMASISCFGVPTAGRVRIARPRDPVRLRSYLAVSPIHAGIGAATSAIATWLAAVIALDVGSGGLAVVAAALGGGFVSSTFMISALHGMGKQSHATAVNAVGSFAMVVATAGLAVVGSDDPGHYLLALAGSRYLQSLIGRLLLRSNVGGGVRYDGGVHRDLLRAGAPALPYQLTAIATFRIDRYLVGAIGGVAAAGVYSVAATLSEMARMVPTSVGQVLLYGRSSGRVSARSERRARRLVLLCAWFVLAMIGLASPWLVDVLFGADFSDAVGPLRILLVGEAFLAAWLVDNRLLVGSGRLGAASATTVVSSVVIVVGDLALISRFDLAGAAWASVLSYASAWWAARRLLRREPAAASEPGDDGARVGPSLP